MLSFIADENFNIHIVNGVLRRLPTADSVVAEAEDGDEAIARLVELRPEVAVLDLDMPGCDGFAVTRAAQEARLAVKVIILTMHKNEELFHKALDLRFAITHKSELS
jgi:two-component system response regulator DesR